MFYIIGFNKTCLYRVKNKYTLIYKYIYGTVGYDGFVDVSFLNYANFNSYRNFRGKPFALDIDSKTNNITYRIEGSAELLFVIKLEYIMRNKGIIEIKSGETRSQIMESGNFPLYYYFKIKNTDYINLDVNLRLNSYDDSVMKNNFKIKGHLLDENGIKRKINGEYMELNNSINGTYSNKFKVGLIEVNQNNSFYNYSYLLIEIINLDTTIINSNLLVELVVKEYYEEIYFMPLDQYIIETFDDKNGLIRKENKYHIYVNQRVNHQIWIEMSREYNDIELIFTNDTHPNGFNCSDFNCSIKIMTGFKKYVIYHIDTDNIYFKVINPHNRHANYMIRYYYGEEDLGYNYSLNSNPIKNYIDRNDDNITLSLTFDPIDILYFNNTPVEVNTSIYFYISALLYKKNETSEELINTTSLLHERFASFEDQVIHPYNYRNPKKIQLTFKNIPIKENYIYDLQIQANVFIPTNIFNEEFLIFTKEVDLTDIKLEEEEDYLWYVLGPILGFIFLLLIAFFVIKYIRLNRSNLFLRERIKSIAYSSDIKKNVLAKEGEESKKDSDYETTFI